MSWSVYAEKKFLDQVFGATAWTAPATLYIALFTAAPTDTGGGTEVTGGSYARVAVTNNGTNFPVATGGTPSSKSNGTQITFPTPSANWNNIVAAGVFDAASGGNLIRWGLLQTSQTVNLGAPAPFFAIGAMSFTEN